MRVIILYILLLKAFITIKEENEKIVMNILYTKSNWEVNNHPLEEFLKRTKKNGFDATEIDLRTLNKPADEVIELHKKYNLQYIAQLITEGKTIAEHIENLEEQAQFAIECKPILVNTHIGKDFFTFDENIKIFKKLISLTNENGIRFVAETHRGRPTYSAIETKKYLDALPELLLTADFSHWMVVHESDLSDQQININAAIERSSHIHARVGYEEGPQVTDPSAPEWKNHLDNHLNIWKKIVNHNKEAGSKFLTITPEFGPPNYMHTLPFSNKPVRDTWEMNVKMKEILQERLLI